MREGLNDRGIERDIDSIRDYFPSVCGQSSCKIRKPHIINP